MSHEIDMSNDRANMAYAGDIGWHGLGHLLSEDADIDTWKKEAGLAWMIKPSNVIYETEQKKQMVMPGRKLLFRSDTKVPLSVVGSEFKVVQPGEVLEFYRDLVETAGFKLDTAGSLFGGRKFWALARCGKVARVMGQDAIAPYLLIASACDGSMATVAHFTSIRVVCNNTLRMAVGNAGQNAKVRVPHNANFDHDRVKRELGVVKDAWGEFLDSVTTLANFKVSRDEAIDLMAGQLKAEWVDENDEELSHEDMLSSSKQLRRIIQLFEGDAKGADYRSSKGTAWGLLNAVTEYCDHEAGSSTGDKSRAFERAHLTDRANFKVAVANELLALAA